MMGIFELAYYLGYGLKKRRDLKLRKKLPCPAISIGNITTGGTGKTPLCIALATEARNRGLNPAILTRGYKGRIKGPHLITADMDAADAGDEPLLMAKKLEGVPIVKGADRYNAGMFYIEKLKSEGAKTVFILDDGFQHIKLYRDIDILLVNALNPFDSRKLLPVGLLREPLKEMKRAGIVLITNALNHDIGPIIDEIKRYNRHAPVFKARRRISHIGSLNGRRYPAKWLTGKDVFAFCGIGDPEGFIAGIKNSGAHLKGLKSFRDHYRYSQSDVDGIKAKADGSGANWIITTEKDIMRITGLSLPDNIVFPVIEPEVEGAFYEAVFGFLKQEPGPLYGG